MMHRCGLAYPLNECPTHAMFVRALTVIVFGALVVSGCEKTNELPSSATQTPASERPTAVSPTTAPSKQVDAHDHERMTSPMDVDPVRADQFRTDGTRRMAERLAELGRVQDLKGNPYLSDRIAAEMIRKLEQPGGTPLITLSRLAPELLKAGKLPEAIDAFEKVESAIKAGRLRLKPHVYAALREYAAIAWLRLGEIENCIANHSAESCLVPIRNTGLHSLERGSRAAIEAFSRELELDPDRRRFFWYLNLAYMTLGEYPDSVPQKWLLDPNIFESQIEFPRFRDRAIEMGLAVQGLSGGCVTEDFDGDGDIDIMASSWGLNDQIRYFQNEGDGTFVDRTVESGLMGIVGGLNLVHGDYDNDGFADVLVLRGGWLGPWGRHPNSLLRGRGNGVFDDVTEAAGLLTSHSTQTAAWVDFDRDGWLDLFIGNESWNRDRQPCELFRNNGDGTFTECAAAAGVDHIAAVKAVAAGDFDNDGWPDLYLSCFRGPNVLLRNLGGESSDDDDGGAPLRFEDVTSQAGVVDPEYSFPTWFFDYDNDGWLDLFVAGYKATLEDIVASWTGLPHEGQPLVLYRNNGDGTFSDVASELGMDCITLPMGANFGDLDNDGWLDIYLGTGRPDFRYIIPNIMLRNGQGKRFFDVTSAGGFGNIQKGHGISFADLDRDGDQDIYTVIGGAYTGDYAFNCMFENPGNDNHWLTIQLVGRSSNRAAIGARIRVDLETADGSRSVHLVAGSGGSFGSSSLQQEIGLGNAISIRQIEIQWPSPDSRQVLTGVTMDQVIRVTEDQDGWEPEDQKR